MEKRLELRLTKDMYDELEIYKIKNRFVDKQDAIRNILAKELFKKNFFDWLKNLF